MTYLGIDPGVKGAYAFYTDSEKYEVFSWCGDMLNIADTIAKFKPKFAVLEYACGIPRQSSSTTWTQGENYGEWKAILSLCCVPFSIEKPNSWRKLARLNMPTYIKSDKLSESQNISKKKKLQKKYLLETGRQRFPKADLSLVKYTDRAEALLIAQAAYFIMEGYNVSKKDN